MPDIYYLHVWNVNLYCVLTTNKYFGLLVGINRCWFEIIYTIQQEMYTRQIIQ